MTVVPSRAEFETLRQPMVPVTRRLLAGTVFEPLLPIHDLAYAAVALYFGVETVTHLQGDRSRAASLFEAGRRLAPLADAMRTNATWAGQA